LHRERVRAGQAPLHPQNDKRRRLLGLRRLRSVEAIGLDAEGAAQHTDDLFRAIGRNPRAAESTLPPLRRE